jgi:hypothetical protein
MKKPVKSTPTIKKLRYEINEFYKFILGHLATGKFEKDALEKEKEKLIEIQIISDCTLIEEAMNIIIMKHILKDSKSWRETRYFGRIKRFMILYDDILGHIFPFQKINIVKKFLPIPRKIESTTRNIFDLRNVFAHHHTIDYTKKRRILYDGMSIFDINNFEKYWNDSIDVKRYFIRRSGVLK